MKKLFIVFCCAAMIGAPQKGDAKSPITHPIVTVSPANEEISVTAVVTQDGQLLITCSSPVDGTGVLQMQDQQGNYIINQQIGVVNGWYNYPPIATKGYSGPYSIHFTMNGGSSRITVTINNP